ncbi:flavin reductase family protein [Fertoebacter nigrum]|uniref:Flavin reductase family protein n=1 Tax=Fertoeibacter niger TaxID=2656921 RepID=A0A8X8KLB3_9RHOB|nr:flavin reductase family protein [Fertoeibacter niger]NUB45139.1 flavin reductase family protein [Fertoeibacter niger]
MTEASFAPDAANARAFRNALGAFATGVTVVTIASSDGPMGITANSFASVSLDPPLVLWSPARSSSRFVHFAEASHFAVHVLPLELADLCGRFSRGGPGFDGLEVTFNPAGVPLLAGSLARFECETHATHEGGDHRIVVGLVTQVTMRDGEPLLFSRGAFGRFSAGL